jgi:hypothetical protein
MWERFDRWADRSWELYDRYGLPFSLGFILATVLWLMRIAELEGVAR